MDASAFDFELPPDRIAQHPVEPRDRSRLMVLRRSDGTIADHTFRDLPDLLDPGDLLARNASKVIPARLLGHREATGGRWEGLFLSAEPDGSWWMMTGTRGRPRAGEAISVEGGLRLLLVERGGEGRWRVRPEGGAHFLEALEKHGQVPLPPYIRKGREGPGDRERYQTVYAEAPGSVAAPTAGLHFTPEVFARLQAREIGWLDVTLHVGIGTFKPIQAERIEDHALHAEWGELSPEAADRLNAQRAADKRIVSVGTTSARVLEQSALGGRFEPFRAETALYLRPGHEFRGLDALLTNFHLPRSSLLVLVAAFAGLDFALEAYRRAIATGYRFYSYGDAMLIL